MTQKSVLIPLSQPKAVGLGVGRRTLGRRVVEDPEFPPVVRIKGRLYVEEGRLDEYKRRLIQRGLSPPRGDDGEAA